MKNKKRRFGIGLFALLCAFVAAFVLHSDRVPGGVVLMQKLRGQATVSDRVTQFGSAVRTRWQPYFQKKGVVYPPQKLLLVGLKREKQLQVYAANSKQPLQLIRTFPVLGLSGKLGPKLHLDDMQVPEGFYQIESLNPNSQFHLALRVNYPNAFDRLQAEKDGRTELGGDIMIHGSNGSVGCLAMGDETAEDLFVLAAQVGRENIQVVLSPVDFRVIDVPADAKRPLWVNDLYTQLKAALLKLPTR